MKGLFIPGITVEMFRNGSLEGVAELMADGEIYDIDYQEPNEDCIRRAKALKVIKQIDIPEDMSVFEIKSHIGVEIGTLPPATPKRKVGEWIKKNNDYFDWYECSECGYGSDGEMKYNRLCDVRTKFCPDCGTQMLEVENEIN